MDCKGLHFAGVRSEAPRLRPGIDTTRDCIAVAGRLRRARQCLNSALFNHELNDPIASIVYITSREYAMIASVERLFAAPVAEDPLGTRRRPAEPASETDQVVTMLRDMIAVQQQTQAGLAEMQQELAGLRQSMDLPPAEPRDPTGRVTPFQSYRLTEMEARIRRIERCLDIPRARGVRFPALD